MKKSSLIWLLLALGLGAAILMPQSNIHGFLATGDHGRDLYAIAQTTHGADVYRDYWWVYGPLMPYYYNIFYQLLGQNIHSVLIGESFLVLMTGLLLGSTVRLFAGSLAGLVIALWFWLFHAHFFYTYNHSGGITTAVMCLWAMSHYLRSKNKNWLWIAIASALALSFIKVNFGLIAWLIISISVLIQYLTTKEKKKHWYQLNEFWTLVIFPLFVVGGYAWTLRGLTLYEIRQCLPYLAEDHPMHMAFSDAMMQFFQVTWGALQQEPAHLIIMIFFLGSLIKVMYDICTSRQRDIVAISVLTMAAAFYILYMHEYVKSGVWYRTYWSQPFGFVVLFMTIALAIQSVPRKLQHTLWSIFLLLGAVTAYNQFNQMKQLKQPHAFLNHPRGQVYIRNHPQWTQTVLQTTYALEQNLNDNETFFVLPYDPLYYYLTNRSSPTRQTIFFDHINIPTEQEQKIIQELEENNTNYFVISSRQSSQETGMGTFGQTYCPLLGAYLNKHFQLVQQFGDWKNHPGWAWHHGTRIYKRK